MHRCEYSSKLLHEGVGREVHIAQGEAECYMNFRDLPPYVEYERIRCINWFVVWKRVPRSQLALKKDMVECSSLFWESMTNSEEYA